MEKPYIICHMVTSIDGKVTGDFLYSPVCEKATELYYELNRDYNKNGAFGFICGRITMESSFTGGWYPDLTSFKAEQTKNDFIPDNKSGFYAVSFDPKGKLGWKNNIIIDEDPGYGGAQIVEVITEQVDGRYITYLKNMGIPYIFAGKTEIDVSVALDKLKRLLGIDTLLLEGGSIINGHFQRIDAIDELSLVVAPIVANRQDKPLFTDSVESDFELKEIRQHGDVIWINYRKAHS